MHKISLPTASRELLREGQDLEILVANEEKEGKIRGRVHIPKKPIINRDLTCGGPILSAEVFFVCKDDDVAEMTNTEILQLRSEASIDIGDNTFRGLVRCFTNDGTNLIFIDWDVDKEQPQAA